MAGVNKLRREGMQRSTDVSEISDGFKTPEDTESITSDIFGVPDFVREGEESFNDRLQRSGYLGRVDENSCSVSSSSSRPARRSTTNELFDERPNRYTAARPVARRSVSRELFDLKYGSGATSPSPYSSTVPESDSTVLSPRHTRYSREGSSSRDSGLDPSPYSSSLRSSSISRPEHLPRPGLPSRPGLASGGRSNTQAEILRHLPWVISPPQEADTQPVMKRDSTLDPVSGTGSGTVRTGGGYPCRREARISTVYQGNTTAGSTRTLIFEPPTDA